MFTKRFVKFGVLLLASVFMNESQASNQNTFRVATVNLWHWGPNPKERFKEIAKLLMGQAQKPDVILLQEVKKYDSGAWNSADFLNSKLSGYQSHILWRDDASEAIAVLVKKSAVEGLAFEDLKFKKGSAEWATKEEIRKSLSKSDYQRSAIFLHAKLKDGHKIAVVNVHLAHDETYGALRKRQLKKILDFLNQSLQVDPKSFVVLGGDFNTGVGAKYNDSQGREIPFYQEEFNLFLQSKPWLFQDSPNVWNLMTYSDPKTGSRYRTDFLFHMIPNRSPMNFLGAEEEAIIMIDGTEPRLSDHNGILHTYKWE